MSDKRVLADVTGAAASGQGEAVQLQSQPAVVYCECHVTAAAAAGADLLDVFVETEVAGQWVEVIHFSQVPGSVNNARYINKLVGNAPQAEYTAGDSLAVKSKRHTLGSKYRAKYTIAGTAPSFDFKVTLQAESR